MASISTNSSAAQSLGGLATGGGGTRRRTFIDIDNLTLEHVMDDDVGRSLLAQFMESIHNLEPILFINRVEEYMTYRSSCNRYQVAQEILDQFIRVKSVHEINISQQTRIGLLAVFEKECCPQKKCPRDLFDSCVASVMIEMKEDIWPRFLNSDQCQALIGDVAFESILERRQQQLQFASSNRSNTTTTTMTTPNGNVSSSRANDNVNMNNSYNGSVSYNSRMSSQWESDESSTSSTASESLSELKRSQSSASSSSMTTTPTNTPSPQSAQSPYLLSPSMVVTHNTNDRPYITEDDTIMLRRFCLPPTAEIDEALWYKMSSHRSKYELHSTKVPVKMNGKSIKMWRMSGLVNCSVEVLFGATALSSNRKQYDGCLTQVNYLGYRSATDVQSKFSSSIMYEHYSYPIVNDRETICACTVKYETYTDRYWKRYIIAKKSIPYEQLARAKNTIRAEGISLHIVEQANAENTLSRYYRCEWIDMKGSIISWMWNRIVKRRAELYSSRIEESVRDYRAKMPFPETLITKKDEPLMETLVDYLKNNTPRHSAR